MSPISTTSKRARSGSNKKTKNKKRAMIAPKQLDNAVAAATRAGAIAQNEIVAHATYSKKQLFEFLEKNSKNGNLEDIIDVCGKRLEKKILAELNRLPARLNRKIKEQIVQEAVSIAKTRITDIMERTLGISAATEVFAAANDRSVNPIELANARRKVNAFHHRKKTNPRLKPSKDVLEARTMVNQFNYQRRKLKQSVSRRRA